MIIQRNIQKDEIRGDLRGKSKMGLRGKYLWKEKKKVMIDKEICRSIYFS